MGQICKTLMPKVLCCVIKGVVVCASLFIVFLFLLLCTKVDIIGFFERGFRGDHALPVLNISIHHTPIVIVDEHSEVIPYWYKAVEEGLLQDHGNTLIHFDAHSDMATPHSYTSVMSTHPLEDHDFLPLMQTHDGYIMSAVMKKLITTVIWVKPNWLNKSEPNSTITTYDAFVGVAGLQKEDAVTVCTCKRKHRRRGHNKRHHRHYHCCYVTGGSEADRKVVSIPHSTCRTINKYRYIVLNEIAFMNLMAKQMRRAEVNMKKLLKNTIIDADEDYFSIESDAQRLINEGMESHKLVKIDQTIGYLYCPETTDKEEDLHHQLKHLVKRLSKPNANLTKSNEHKKLLLSTQKYFCNSKVDKKQLLNDFIEYISALPQHQLMVLRTARFCLLHSPRLKNLPVHFGICQHNYTHPRDREILHHASDAEIKVRSERLANILRYVSKYGNVNMFTVARSLRDGSTPISLQRGIEKTMLFNLKKVLKENGRDAHVVYDKHLVYGKDGR